MRILSKILLLATFALLVFLPRGVIDNWLYLSLFLLMFFEVFWYYRITYWVGVADLPDMGARHVRLTLFCGKVPPMNSEDLVRGRLVFTDSEVVLYQRYHDRKKGLRSKQVWSKPISEIARFSLGRVVGARNGLILVFHNGDEAKFTSRAAMKMKAEITTALGWDG